MVTQNLNNHQLKELLIHAVEKTYQENFLIKNNALKGRAGIEQSLVFRVGIHLHELLKDTSYMSLDLDSEYNKFIDDTKRTSHFPKGIRPDLILHSRGNQKNNILAVEFKGWWNMDLESDREKLKDLTDIQGPYCYQLGALVVFELEKPCFEFFP